MVGEGRVSPRVIEIVACRCRRPLSRDNVTSPALTLQTLPPRSTSYHSPVDHGEASQSSLGNGASSLLDDACRSCGGKARPRRRRTSRRQKQNWNEDRQRRKLVRFDSMAPTTHASRIGDFCQRDRWFLVFVGLVRFSIVRRAHRPSSSSPTVRIVHRRGLFSRCCHDQSTNRATSQRHPETETGGTSKDIGGRSGTESEIETIVLGREYIRSNLVGGPK